jgi:hypothetical protein
VLVYLVKALSADPSSIFASSLLDPLLNGLRSSSESVRTSAIALFKEFAQRSKEEEHVLKVVSEMTKQLTTGKVSSPDHRGIFYDCIGKTAATKSEAVSAKALQGLTTMTSKESNETAVTFGIDATILHLQVLLASGKDLPEIATSIKAGVAALGSPRASLRKTWARGMGSLIWNCKLTLMQEDRIWQSFVPHSHDIKYPLILNNSGVCPRIGQACFTVPGPPDHCLQQYSKGTIDI